MNTTQEIANLAHMLNDIITIQDVIKKLVEKANEINANLEPRIVRLKERLDRLAGECEKKGNPHATDHGEWP